VKKSVERKKIFFCVCVKRPHLKAEVRSANELRGASTNLPPSFRTKWKRTTSVGLELLAETGNLSALHSLYRTHGGAPPPHFFSAAAAALGYPGAGAPIMSPLELYYRQAAAAAAAIQQQQKPLQHPFPPSFNPSSMSPPVPASMNAYLAASAATTPAVAPSPSGSASPPAMRRTPPHSLPLKPTPLTVTPPLSR
jgi:hypothetical protein